MRLHLFLLLASGVFLAACADDAASDSTVQEATTADASGESWTARGVFLGSRFEGQAATIEHEAIPDFMDAMRMDFLLASPEAVEALEVGDKVSFRLDYDGNRVIASGFETLPDSTTLVLAAGATPPDSTD